MKWLAIVNPKAGGGSAGRSWPCTETMLKKSGIRFAVRFTRAPEQTRLLASNSINLGFDGVIVYGGDGTLSDTAAALSSLSEKPVLAALPAGSGNDWIRSIGFNPGTIDSCIKAIRGEKTKLVDSGECIWPGGSKFFLNSAGVGFDALVARRAFSFRKLFPFGKTSYLLVLAFSALFPPHWRATISSDGKPVYRGDYLTLTSGVGAYSGGGMLLSPSAVSDDGFLDTVILSPMNFFTIARQITKLFDGTLQESKLATSLRGSVIRIEPARTSSLVLELDGDVVVPGKDTEYIELVSKPADLRVIVPSEEQN